jgi:hypothetical protein
MNQGSLYSSTFNIERSMMQIYVAILHYSILINPNSIRVIVRKTETENYEWHIMVSHHKMEEEQVIVI